MPTALIDTHVLVWLIADPARISRPARRFLSNGPDLGVSALTAFEYEDLRTRGRLPRDVEFGKVETDFDLTVLAPPPDLWRLAAALPDIHRDPVDRMLTAHAIHAEMILLTADENIRKYPAQTLW